MLNVGIYVFSFFLIMIFSYFLYITEPLQKLKVMLGAFKTGLSPPVTLCYCSFQGDTSVVVLFVLCLGV